MMVEHGTLVRLPGAVAAPLQWEPPLQKGADGQPAWREAAQALARARAEEGADAAVRELLGRASAVVVPGLRYAAVVVRPFDPVAAVFAPLLAHARKVVRYERKAGAAGPAAPATALTAKAGKAAGPEPSIASSELAALAFAVLPGEVQLKAAFGRAAPVLPTIGLAEKARLRATLLHHARNEPSDEAERPRP